MLENDPLRRAGLPRALTHSRLFRNSTARRLFKARHLELESLDIRTRVISLTVEEGVVPITFYSMVVRHRQTTRRSSETGNPWVVEHRYSEFRKFRQRLLERIKLWEKNAANAERGTKEFMAMSNALRRPFTPDFPRRRIRVDTEKIIQERCIGLQAFVLKLLAAYVDVSVYLQECASLISKDSHTHMRSLASDLEEFLNVPESQKEEERFLTSVIYSMEDVDEVIDSDNNEDDDKTQGYECCICMNTDHADVSAVPGEDKMVKLPCSHHFHEDCVIDWFSTSITCPLCRQDIVGSRKGE